MQIKTEIEGIYRDVSTGALLNKDSSSLEAYKKIKRKHLEMEEIKQKVNTLTSEISEIKSLLLKVLEKTE